MAETYRFSSGDQKNLQTADDFYPPSRTQQYKNTSVNSLQVSLNSQKSRLRNHEYEQAAFKDKLASLDLNAEKLVIANEFLSKESESLSVKNTELLNQKGLVLDELKDWKEALECLKVEANNCSGELIEWKKKIVTLEEKQYELKEKVKVQSELNFKIEDYSVKMEEEIQLAENELGQSRQNNDKMVQTLTTLETFAKSFKKNIIQKEKEVSRSSFDLNELQNMISTKLYEKSNLQKEKDQSEWECKTYDHHNNQITKTNDKLKSDLSKLLAHLEGLKKSNKYLNGCMKEYSETGVAAAKKILQLSNK